MKKYKFLIIPFILIGGLLSYFYHSYKVIDGSNLNEAFIVNSAPNFKGYYYIGTDEHYHYFMSKWDYVKDRYFKIAIKDMKVYHPDSFQKDIQIRIDVFKTDSIFGEISGHKIYYMK